ncbi:MAG: GGDEF domain-containing protein [Burkholderiales bacterium]
MNWAGVEAEALRDRSRAWTYAALAAIALVGVVDYATGPEITFSVFYLVPVAIAAWLSGIAIAVIAALVAALAWLVAEVASSRIAEAGFVYAWNFFARFLFLLLVAVLLAHLRRMLLREREVARVDPLTRLLNGRAFRERAEAEIRRAQRYAHPISLAFVDLNGFKQVNDVHGHAAGDRLLAIVGETLRAHLRDTDSAARLGGDEFAILLPMADAGAAHAAMDKIRIRLHAATALHGTPIDFCAGIVSYPSSPPPLETMLERADALMYAAKAGLREAAGAAGGS